MVDPSESIGCNMMRLMYLQAARQLHVVQTLMKIIAKCEGLQSSRQLHVVQTLVKTSAKCKGLQVTRQPRVV